MEIPESCTLPKPQQPLRVAEFEALFATSLRHVERRSPTHLRMTLAAGTRPTVEDLTARETACCSFFTFTVTTAGDHVLLDIEVPPAQTAVLDALAGLTMRTSEVAAAAGVNTQTLRYYERRGLLAEPERSPGGHRLYPAETVTALRIIKAAQRLGFTLGEIAEAAGLQAQAQAKLQEIDAKLADLQTIRATLVEAVDAGCDDLAVCAESPRCPLPFSGP